MGRSTGTSLTSIDPGNWRYLLPCRRRVTEWDTSGMDNWGAPLYGDPCRECGFSWATGLAASTSLKSS